MSRTQLNINIDPQLMAKLREGSIKSGKTIAEFVSESIFNQLENAFPQYSDSRLIALEARLAALEKNSITSSWQKSTPFTEEEASNCNQFFKGIFQKEIQKKEYASTKEAWNDLIGYIKCFEQWNDFYTLRLKEILFIHDGDPFTSQELNGLTAGKVCPCPIRTGLINWINNGEKGSCSCLDEGFPSQQNICNHGVKLLDELYSS